jgi:hypothetical protein
MAGIGLVDCGFWIVDFGWWMVDGEEMVRLGLTAHATYILGDLSVLPCYFFSPEGDFYVKK